MIKTPWEESDDFIRSGHRSPDDFQPDSIRTITISQKEGIKAVIGKPKGKKTTEIQSYLFAKNKGWTLEKAKAWFEKHKSESLPGHAFLFDLQFLTEKADPETRIFPWSMPAKYYMKPGRTVIYGTALLAGETSKGDKFSCEELTRAARGLVGGPIEVFEHTWDVGESRWLPFPDNIILDGEEVDGRLEYIAGIADSKVQELIREKTIAKVSVNTICRHVPAEDPGQCDGMILNGFCLLHKDSIPASPGTSVNIWNCLKVNPNRLKSVSMPCLSDSEEGKNMTTEKNGEKPPETKTEQIKGTGPEAGVVEPSVEDRVKTLEQRFQGFMESVDSRFNTVTTKLDTLIQLQPAIATSSAPAVVAPPRTAAGPIVLKENLSKEEIEAKIKELSLQREQLYQQQDELGKAIEKASEAEREAQKEKRRQINEQLDVLWTELEGYRQAFTKLLIGEIVETGTKTEKEWDTEYINNLPDSAFAVIGAGGEKDDQGKTVPRTLRHLPHHNLQGGLDLPHLQNALARMNQIEDASKTEAKQHLCAHAIHSKIESEFCGEKPEKKMEKESALAIGQAITKPVGELPPEQPGMIPVAKINQVLENPRLFTPQLREKAIRNLVKEAGKA